jgi:hypothetical protein
MFLMNGFQVNGAPPFIFNESSNLGREIGTLLGDIKERIGAGFENPANTPPIRRVMRLTAPSRLLGLPHTAPSATESAMRRGEMLTCYVDLLDYFE